MQRKILEFAGRAAGAIGIATTKAGAQIRGVSEVIVLSKKHCKSNKCIMYKCVSSTPAPTPPPKTKWCVNAWQCGSLSSDKICLAGRCSDKKGRSEFCLKGNHCKSNICVDSRCKECMSSGAKKGGCNPDQFCHTNKVNYCKTKLKPGQNCYKCGANDYDDCCKSGVCLDNFKDEPVIDRYCE